MTHTPSLRLRRAVHAASLGLLLGSGGLSLPLAAAESASTQAQPSWKIPAGTLASALDSYARQAGVSLSYQAHDLEGKRSSGLEANLSPREALDALLQGSGLEALPQSANTYLLQPARHEGALELAPTSIIGSGSDEVSEGSGSYAVRNSSSATHLNLALRETPQTISVMSRQRVDDMGLNSLSQVLEQTPGLSVQHVDSERFSIYSRGYSIDNYQFDGVPTTLRVQTTATPQSMADLAIYDRVEVIRGATGLMTGAGDPSGSVNLVRKRPTETFQGYVSAGLGSWDLYRTEVDVSGPLTDNGRLRGRSVLAYQQNNSFIDHYQQQKQVYYGILEADLSDSTLFSVGVDYQRQAPRGVSYAALPLFYSDGSQTHFSRSTNPAARWSQRKQDTVNTFASLEQALANDWALKVSLNQMYSSRDGDLASASWGFPDKQTGEGVMLYGGGGGGWQKQTGVDAQLKGPFQWLGREHELIVGLSSSLFLDHNAPDDDDLEGREVNFYDWNNQTARPLSQGQLFDNDTTIRQSAIYLASRFKPSDNLSLILGTRVSDYRLKETYDYIPAAYAALSNVTRARETGVVTPYAGVVYDITPEHSAYISYTSIFSPQTYRDRNGSVLAPREGDNYEIGLKSEYLGGRLTSAIALYEVRQNNLAEADSGYTVPGTDNERAYRSVSGAKTHGLDLELTGELLTDVNLSASYSHSVTKDADGERITTVAPADLFKLWGTYRLPGDWHGLTLGGGVNWQSGIHFSDTPWQLGKTVKAKQDDYAVVNLMGRYQFNEHLSTTLNVNNLFDKKYISSLDTNFYGYYYGDPRNLLLTTRWTF